MRLSWHNGSSCRSISSWITSLPTVGRGWTFDDLEEATGISEESHRLFFHKFIRCGGSILFDKWVKAPSTESEIEDSICEYNAAGYPGCIGSTDATHVIIDKYYKVCGPDGERDKIPLPPKVPSGPHT